MPSRFHSRARITRFHLPTTRFILPVIHGFIPVVARFLFRRRALVLSAGGRRGGSRGLQTVCSGGHADESAGASVAATKV